MLKSDCLHRAAELVWKTCMMVYENQIEVDANIYAGLTITELTSVFQARIDAVNMLF